MKKGNTVQEDEKKKEELRRQKRQAQIEKHLVPCPHCGEKVLDHMTKCHKCGGELTPRGYKPMNPKTEKIVKGVLWGVGIVAAIGVLLLIIFKS